MLATGALVASLLAVGAGPAAALDETSEPNRLAEASACVGDATDDQMFDDVSEMHYFRAAINCLAYYRITIGYGDGTFRPNADISNEEMILFMERAADLAGADAETVVGDFAMTGSDPVNRGDMALLIARLLVAATNDGSPVNVTNKDDGTFAIGTLEMDYFVDSRRLQNRVHDSAASALYELGVAKGTGGGNFSPASTVSRGAMAAFITRALDHTNARPAGLTAQTDGGIITVSVRDANFAPVVNQAIDAFSISAADEARAFKDDGTCQTGRLTAVDGDDQCEIDGGDPVTRTNGNVPLPQIVNSEIGDGLTVWVWTGDDGDTYNDDTTDSYVLSVTKGTQRSDPESAAISTDFSKDASLAHFGSTVTVTIQLKAAAGTETVDVGPGDAEVEYSVYTEYFTGKTPAADAEAFKATTSSVKVGPDGSASFPIVASDPSAQASNSVTVRYTVSRSVVLEENTAPDTLLVPDQGDPDANAIGSGVAQGTNPETYRFTDTYTGSITFSDDAAKVTTVTVEAPNKVAPGPSANTRITATVTVLDQFGKPFRGAAVVLTSDNTTDTALPNSDLSTEARFTGSDGKVGIRYSYTGAASVETLTATWNGDAADATDTGGPGCVNDQNTGLDRCGQATVYWIGQIRDDNSGTTADPALAPGFVDFTSVTFVRDHDAASRQVVVAAAAAANSPPHAINYDSGDYFNVVALNAANADVTTPSTMAEFEAALAKRLAVVAEDSSAAAPQLSWTNYDYDDSVKITVFTLDVTPS